MQQAFLMAAYVHSNKMGLQEMKEQKIQELSQRIIHVVRWHLTSQGQTLGETGALFRSIQESVQVTMNQVTREMEESHIDQLDLLRVQYNDGLSRVEEKNQDLLARALLNQNKLRDDLCLHRLNSESRLEMLMDRETEMEAMTRQYGK